MNNKLLFCAFSFLLLNACSVNDKQTSQTPDMQNDPGIEETNNATNNVANNVANNAEYEDIPEVIVDIKSAEHRRVPADEPAVLHHRDNRVERKAQPRLTNKQRFTGVLQAHNQVRLKHGLSPLRWSDKLAKYSQEWADHLGRGNHCQIRHRSGNPPYGENLYRSSALQWSDGRTELMAINIKEVVKSWTDEERWYDYQSNRCQPGRQCGHYTQVVWKDTTEVGCAVKVCADKSQTWVCSYNPAGNYTGVRPY